MREGILKGIRVLDFTWVLAGPYSTRILADFGAEVIKIQSLRMTGGPKDNLNGYFCNWNRNKLGITLDMSHMEARELFLRLVRLSDVVVDNFSPRVMENWGLTYETLRKVNPRIISASISAMGQTGPWRNCVAFGPGLQALSGLTYLSSYDERRSVGAGFAYGDHVMGLYGALGILAAIENRFHTGEGCRVDLSGYEAVCSVMGAALMEAAQSEAPPRPNGNQAADAGFCGCYPCRGEDRWCVFSTSTAAEWQALTHLLNSGQLRPEAPRETQDRCISAWTRARTAEEAVECLQHAGIPAGIVQNAEDLVHDPHLIDRQFWLSLNHPVLGRMLGDRFPARFACGETEDWRPAPQLGEDNRYVFRDILKLTEEEFIQAKKKGVIR